MLALALTLILAQRQPAPLQPYAASSPSGEWTLEVRPTRPSGLGPMRARILRKGEASFEGELPWTFEAAGVSDDGTCVGYANRPELRVAVLDSAGRFRAQHAFEHTAFPMHAPSLPKAVGGVLIHPSADLAWIRVVLAQSSRPSPFRPFRLSTGAVEADVRPRMPDPRVSAREARALGDTGLTLVHWWLHDYRPVGLDWAQEGAVFALHDLTGAVVWSLALPDDYTDRESEEADDRLERELRRAQGTISAGPGPRFALRHVREKARVEYAVEKEGERWVVREVSRAPWADALAAAEPELEALALAHLGTVSLRGAAPPTHPVHGVFEMGFTEAGELELWRRDDERALSYARLRTDGTVVLERELGAALPEGKGTRSFHELAGDRWLVQSGGEPPWLALDVLTGEREPQPLPDAGGSYVAPLSDGGYVALLRRTVRSQAVRQLYHVRADGTVAWQHTVDGIGPDATAFDRAVYFGHGVARTSETTIAMLAMSDLVVADLDRNVFASWPLEEILGHRAGYMSGLLSDGRGGVLFEEGDAIHRVDFHGARTASFVPKRADGSRGGSMGHLLRVAPDGRLWTSDGDRVFRLDDAGVADLVLGPELADDVLVDADGGALDALGRSLLQEHHSSSVHVFDPEGRPVAVCRLAPSERGDDWDDDEGFGGERDGTLWLQTIDGVARFDAAGTRLPEVERRKLGELRTGLGDDERRALSGIKARPDGTWLDGATRRAVLLDGRSAILEAAQESGGTPRLHLYGAGGEPLRTLALPAGPMGGEIAVGERWLVLGGAGYASWVLVRLSDERVFRFDTGLEGGWWRPGLTPDGRTLLLLDSAQLRLARYELP